MAEVGKNKDSTKNMRIVRAWAHQSTTTALRFHCLNDRLSMGASLNPHRSQLPSSTGGFSRLQLECYLNKKDAKASQQKSSCIMLVIASILEDC